MLDKLVQLEENIQELEKLRAGFDAHQLQAEKLPEWALRYGLFESIQIVIDIACHISSEYNLGNPQTYKQCVELLQKYKYIETDLGERLKKMIGLRNLLVHEYVRIDLEELYSYLDQLDDFKMFAEQIKEYLS
ncbi:DUF86 domain-containing protein [Candidatus Parcubacteria bacterium]|nr:MAG: DUF86 domain-containing protein [Candidatus Parcubacteria bacterium]